MRMCIPSFLLMMCLAVISCKEKPKIDPAKKYKVTARHSGKAMTLSYNRTLQTISDTAGTTYRWHIRYFSDSTAQILSLPSGQAIELADVKDQVLPYITGADSTNTRQRFRIDRNENGSVYLASVYSGYCIDISESDTADYPVITTWPKEPNPNQQWKLIETKGEVVFASLLNGKFLAATPLLTEAGANIGQWPFANRQEQCWTFQQQDDGTYLVRNEFSGMYLQESDGSLSLKYNVHQHPDASGNNTRWHLDDPGDGWVKFRNAASGYCLDVRDGVPYDGANIMTYDCEGGANNQWWKLEEVTQK